MTNCFRFACILVVVLTLVSGLNAQTPSAPAGLTVAPGFFGSAVLHWDTVADAGWYRVYKSVNDTTFQRIGETYHHDFLDDDVAPFHTFYYFVTAVNLSGEGPASDTVPFQLDQYVPPPVHGTIQGTVTDDSSGLPLSNALVTLFDYTGLWTAQVHTDTGGNYHVLGDTGKYFVVCGALGYAPQWYDHVGHLDSATSLTVLQDSSYTVNFSLHRFHPPVPAAVSGTVRDSLTGQPLRGTLVAFIRSFRGLRDIEDATHTFGGPEAERHDFDVLGRWYGVLWAGLTDSNGVYTAHITAGYPYVAVAFKPGYVLRFYHDKPTPFDADRIVVSGDTSGFDFDLISNPLATNSIAGSVLDSSGIGIPSHVVLFRKTIYGFEPVRYRMTDSVGNFSFDNLVNGVFAIKALPVGGYAPAWYSASACGVHNWHDADTLHVTGDVTGVTVCVAAAPEGGFASIAGHVGQNQTPLTAKGRATQTTTPINGATVYAADAGTGTLVATDVTEPDGSYTLDNLPPGTYTISVDKEGYTQSGAQTVIVDGSNSYLATASDVVMTPDVSLGVKPPMKTLPTAFRLEQNYPNPFNPTTEIRFAVPVESDITLRVYNLIGQEVIVLLQEAVKPGIRTVTWNATDASNRQVGSGIYFIKMVAVPLSGDPTPFTQTRKMILLR